MNFVQKNKLELSDTVVSDLFILNNMQSLSGIDLKLYLYILFLSKNSISMDAINIAKKLGSSEQEILAGFEKLQSEDLILKTSQGFNIIDLKDVEVNKSYIPKVESKTNKIHSEKEKKRLAAASAINESFFQGIMSFGWYNDIGAIFEKYDFTEEVMIALFHYCQERKALNKKYVHAVAETWYNGGVKSFEQLEDYLENYDNMQKIKQKISKSLRLSRNFTKYEEQYIDTWIKEFKYDFDVIEEALKRTVSKANPTLNYVNGILSNWYKKGYKTVTDIKNEVNDTKNKVFKTDSKPKVKYQNYEQRKYDDLESFYDNM